MVTNQNDDVWWIGKLITQSNDVDDNNKKRIINQVTHMRVQNSFLFCLCSNSAKVSENMSLALSFIFYFYILFLYYYYLWCLNF